MRKRAAVNAPDGTVLYDADPHVSFWVSIRVYELGAFDISFVIYPLTGSEQR